MKKLFLIPALLFSLQLIAQTNPFTRTTRGNDFIRVKPEDQNPTLTIRQQNPNVERKFGMYNFIRVRPEDQNPILIFKPSSNPLPRRK